MKIPQIILRLLLFMAAYFIKTEREKKRIMTMLSIKFSLLHLYYNKLKLEKP